MINLLSKERAKTKLFLQWRRENGKDGFRRVPNQKD